MLAGCSDYFFRRREGDMVARVALDGTANIGQMNE